MSHIHCNVLLLSSLYLFFLLVACAFCRFPRPISECLVSPSAVFHSKRHLPVAREDQNFCLSQPLQNCVCSFVVPAFVHWFCLVVDVAFSVELFSCERLFQTAHVNLCSPLLSLCLQIWSVRAQSAASSFCLQSWFLDSRDQHGLRWVGMHHRKPHFPWLYKRISCS